MNEIHLLSVFVLILLIYTIKNTQETSKNCNYIYKTPKCIKKSNVEKFQFEDFDNDPVNDRVNENFLHNLDDSMNYTESLWNTTNSQESMGNISSGFETTTPEYINSMTGDMNELFTDNKLKSRVLDHIVENPANEDHPWNN